MKFLLKILRTIDLYESSGKCEPIIISNLDDYNSKTIGQVFEFWLGSNGVASPTNKSYGQIALEIASIIIIVVEFLFVCCALVQLICYWSNNKKYFSNMTDQQKIPI